MVALVYTVVFGLRSASLALCDGAWGGVCMERDTADCAGEGVVESWMALLYVIGVCGLLGTQTAAAGMCYHLYMGEWPMGVQVVDDQRLRPAEKAPEPQLPPPPPPLAKDEPITVIAMRDPAVEKILRPSPNRPLATEVHPESYISTREPRLPGTVINPNGNLHADRTVVGRRNADKWGF